MGYQLGLIGYPLGHSLSPWIHKNFLKRAGLKGTYELYELAPDSFTEGIQAFKQTGITGFNITVPHKEMIIPHLDVIAPEARTMGAVNTVSYKDGKWHGYNTDGSGYVRSLYLAYPELKKKQDQQVLILGAGGAARGIFHALIQAGFTKITIANRTTTSAQKLAEEAPLQCEVFVSTLAEVENQLANYGLIIQTSSVGMSPNVSESIVEINVDLTDIIVSDIVYKPLKTAFLQAAEAHNAKICYGHTMLLYQALYAFEIWTGQEIDETGLADELQSILEGE